MPIEVAQAIGALSEKVNEMSQRLDTYAQLLNSQRQSDIDYLAMETGVDLDQDDTAIQEGDK